MRHSPEELGRRMEALHAWGALHPFLWALRPLKSAIPYFCTVGTFPPDSPLVATVMLIWGWQSFHDFVRLRNDADFGYRTEVDEFPSFVLEVRRDGTCVLQRTEEGFCSRILEPNAGADNLRELAARLLWEVYGVMLRMEAEPKLPMKFAADQSVFSRREVAPDQWIDEPLRIPDPPPFVEQISLPKDDLKRARDLPLVTDEAVAVDFARRRDLILRDAPHRSVYRLLLADCRTNQKLVDQSVVVTPELSLRDLWQTMPAQVLTWLIRQGSIPGELHVRSGRMFRFLRPICMELPVKLTRCDSLPVLDKIWYNKQ